MRGDHECDRIESVRLVTLLLSVTLIGPAVGALVCDWTCAGAHQTAAETGSNCHDAPGPAQTATLDAGHRCHELPVPAACIVTCAAPYDDAAETVDTATHGPDIVQAGFVTRRPDRAHAPPPTQPVPLRI
jgi:hypothetical protein